MNEVTKAMKNYQGLLSNYLDLRGSNSFKNAPHLRMRVSLI